MSESIDAKVLMMIDGPRLVDARLFSARASVLDALYEDKALPDFTLLGARLRFFARYFLGVPLCFGALGEGQLGRFDQNPTYRFDCFDCMTYVATVVALSISRYPADFKVNLRALLYHSAENAYLRRRHFVSLDWNRDHELSGCLTNLTPLFVDAWGHPIAEPGACLY